MQGEGGILHGPPGPVALTKSPKMRVEEFFLKKLAEGSAYLVYNGIYKNLQKL